MFDINPYAIIAASNISVLILLLLGLFVMFDLMITKIKKDKLSLINAFQSIFYTKFLRIPLGFMFLIIGLIVKFTIRIMGDILKAYEDYNTIHSLEQFTIPMTYTISELAIFVGFIIIFWPTILSITYRLFYKPERTEKFYEAATIIMLILFKFFLTIVGIILFNLLT